MQCVGEVGEGFAINYETAKHRCREKLNMAGLIDDPYVLEKQGIPTVDRPRVEYPDVYNYLIETPSAYTGECLLAYIAVANMTNNVKHSDNPLTCTIIV